MDNTSNICVKPEISSIVYTDILNRPTLEMKEEGNNDENFYIEIKDEPLDNFIDAGSKNENYFLKSRTPEYDIKNEYVVDSHCSRKQDGQGELKNSSQKKAFSNAKNSTKHPISYNKKINDKYLCDKGQSNSVVSKASAIDTKSLCRTSSFKLNKEKLQLYHGQVMLQKPSLQPVAKFQLSQGQILQFQPGQVLLQGPTPQPTIQLSQGQLVQDNILSNCPEKLSTLQQGQVVFQDPKPKPSLQLSEGDNPQEPTTQSLMQLPNDQLLLLPEGGLSHLYILNEETNTQKIVQLQPGLVLLPPYKPNTRLTIQLPQGQFVSPKQIQQSMPKVPQNQFLIQQQHSTLTPLHKQSLIQKPQSLRDAKRALEKETEGNKINQTHLINTGCTTFRKVIPKKKTILEIQDLLKNTEKVTSEVCTNDQFVLTHIGSYTPVTSTTEVEIKVKPIKNKNSDKINANGTESEFKTLTPLHKQSLIQKPQTLRDAKRALEKETEGNKINPTHLINTGCTTFRKVIPKKKSILEFQDLLKTTEKVTIKNKHSNNINANGTESEFKKCTKTLPDYFYSDDYTNDTLVGKNSVISSKSDMNSDDKIRGFKMVHQHITYFNNELGKNITDQELYQHMKVRDDVAKYRFSISFQGPN